MNAPTNIGMRTLIFLTLAAMMALGVGTALAQGPGSGFGYGGGRGFGDGEFGPGHRIEILADYLELTDEQMTAIKGIQAQGLEQNTGFRKELMRLRNELQGEMLKDEPSEEAALALNGKIGVLQMELQSNHLKNRLEVRRQLTQEQRDKMLMMQGRFQSGEGRQGHGRGMGPCGAGDRFGPGYGKGRRGARGSW